MSGAWQLWARQRPALLRFSSEPWHVIEGFDRGDGSPLVRTACDRQLVGRGARISDQRPGGQFGRACPECLAAAANEPAGA